LVKLSVSSDMIHSYSALSMHGHDLADIGDTSYASDGRMKMNIKDYETPVLQDFFEAINPVRFRWKDSDRPQEQQFGLIAQETPIISKYNDEDDQWSISLKKQATINTFGVKALLNRDTDKENRIRKLEAENEGLKDRIDQLEGAN
ncbi:tail fiber domain-containing protein, partial [Salmonella enterica]|uniref:tail fiber domain-containing protein n=1 Tax=Salmonella enterica TaxID=28901 RepID=UPI0010F4A254